MNYTQISPFSDVNSDQSHPDVFNVLEELNWSSFEDLQPRPSLTAIDLWSCINSMSHLSWNSLLQERLIGKKRLPQQWPMCMKFRKQNILQNLKPLFQSRSFSQNLTPEITIAWGRNSVVSTSGSQGKQSRPVVETHDPQT